MMLPFGLMLLVIALMPYLHRHWWDAHYPKVAAALGTVTVAYYLFGIRQGGRMLHVAHE